MKRIYLCALTLSLSLMLGACGAKEEVKEILKQSAENAGESAADEDGEEKAEAAGDKEAQESETEKKSADGVPVLGQEDITDYEGFEYLYCERLRTQSEENKETGKMESKELPVFIPQSDYVSVNMDYVYVDKLGVEVTVQLEPYLRYDAEDYLAYENLEYYVEDDNDPFYRTNYKDMVMSEVEEIDRETARMTVEYCYYNEYDNSYSPVFATYYLTKLENGCTVLVEVEVKGDEVTGKTPELLEELEAFYQFEIDWDADRADKKVEDFLAAGGNNTVSTGYVMFELPDGWLKDRDNADYSIDMYAPGGDAAKAECFVSLQEEYVEYGAFDGIEGNEEELVEVVDGYLAEEGVSAEVSVYGDTCLGTAILSVIEMEEDGEKVVLHSYWIFSGSYMYRVNAAASDTAEENPFVIAEDILKNGQVRE